MPETRERDPRHNFIDFVEMFFVPIWDESPREGRITIIEIPRQKFTREQRIMLNEIKKICENVNNEETTVIDLDDFLHNLGKAPKE